MTRPVAVATSSYLVEIDTRDTSTDDERFRELEDVLKRALGPFCATMYHDHPVVKIDYHIHHHLELHCIFGLALIEIYQYEGQRKATMNKSHLRKALNEAGMNEIFPNYVLTKKVNDSC